MRAHQIFSMTSGWLERDLVSSLKAPKNLDSGEAVSLKMKFCHFMRFRPTDDLISETMEIGERRLQWSKELETPFHAYQQHIGAHRNAEWVNYTSDRRPQSLHRKEQDDYPKETTRRGVYENSETS